MFSRELNRFGLLCRSVVLPVATTVACLGLQNNCQGQQYHPHGFGEGRPLQRLGRCLGVGWGDGYHACDSSGCRPGADLPPEGLPGFAAKQYRYLSRGYPATLSDAPAGSGYHGADLGLQYYGQRLQSEHRSPNPEPPQDVLEEIRRFEASADREDNDGQRDNQRRGQEPASPVDAAPQPSWDIDVQTGPSDDDAFESLLPPRPNREREPMESESDSQGDAVDEKDDIDDWLLGSRPVRRRYVREPLPGERRPIPDSTRIANGNR